MLVDFTDSPQVAVKTCVRKDGNPKLAVNIMLNSFSSERLAVFTFTKQLSTQDKYKQTPTSHFYLICPQVYYEVYGAFSQLSQEMLIIASPKMKC